MAEGKLYVLDTNVLIHDPRALFTFGKDHVGIPFVVLEELDQFKRESSDRGRNAREAIRYLDSLRSRGFLSDGVQLDSGGTIRLILPTTDVSVKGILQKDLADNDILMTTLLMRKAGWDAIFVSKDLNARVKADVLGIPAEDYLKGVVTWDEVYKGWVTIEVPSVQLKKQEPEELQQLLAQQTLHPNEFVMLQARNNPFNYSIFRYISGKIFKPVYQPRLDWPLEARNPHQLMALDLLLDPTVKMVSLIGPAGTGKTFLALLAGLHQVLMQDEYQKLLVSRPVIPLGPDIGYLPGDVQEKLRSWMQPVFDNVDLMIHTAGIHHHVSEVERGYHEHQKKRHKKYKENDTKRIFSIEQLEMEGKISLEAITYMRGRSIPFQFILIDEVQNLSPHEVKTILSRVGEGSKIVIAGDPFQIDAPYLDFSSNGLVVASNKFKGQSLFGNVFLEISERSELSRLAAELL
ncbi:PhoH family protein [Candidatus Babeliales bacterium]|nr:PhoH family protein [Candidatus Babeliales bacterium]